MRDWSIIVVIGDRKICSMILLHSKIFIEYIIFNIRSLREYRIFLTNSISTINVLFQITAMCNGVSPSIVWTFGLPLINGMKINISWILLFHAFFHYLCTSRLVSLWPQQTLCFPCRRRSESQQCCFQVSINLDSHDVQRVASAHF